jgi:hypothetical protein
MKYFYYFFTILYAINLTYSQTSEENELRFLSNKYYLSPDYIIYNIITYNGNCVSGNGYGSSLTQQRCGFSDNLSWKFLNIFARDSFHIITSNLFAMDNYNEKVVNGNPVIGYVRRKGKNQQWEKENVDNGIYFRLRLTDTQYCLDNGNSSKVGTSFIIWECDLNNRNQWFSRQELFPQSDKLYNIVTRQGFCISLISKKIAVHRCGNSSDLLWKFEQRKNEFIIQDKDGNVMDNSEANLRDGNSIVNFGRDEKYEVIKNWNIIPVNNGFYFVLRVAETNFCLDNENSDRPGTHIIFRECNINNKNQWFFLIISR